MAIKESGADTFKAILDKFKVNYVQEYIFDKDRNFRLDFAIVERKIAFEVDGGIYTKGGHVRPMGFMKDCVKQVAAVRQGWEYYRIPVPWLSNFKFYHPKKAHMMYYEDVVDLVKKRCL